MTIVVDGSAIRLSGLVGDYGYDDHFTSGDVVLALAAFPSASEVTIHINSPGGYATEGAAIHSILAARPGRTNIVIEGIAASAGSLIAMAGDIVTMSAGAVLMIHDPSAITAGTSSDHAKSIEGLEALATAYARVYSAKSGKTDAQCRQIMKAETWFTPSQAVSAGFADKTTETKAEAVAAFDYRLFAHAPKRLTALAEANGWSLPGSAEPKPAPKPKEPKMSNATLADAKKQVTARFTAILNGEGAAERPTLAQHLAYETDLDVDAALAIMAKAGVEAPTGDGLPDRAEYERRRQGGPAMRALGAGLSDGARLNGQGLTGPSSSGFGGVDLVASMKRRHGIKE